MCSRANAVSWREFAHRLAIAISNARPHVVANDIPEKKRAMTTASLHTDDAEIVFDVEGSGPLLLAIPGRGGTAPRYAGISAILRDTYTVVRYDRRCCGRSSGDKTRPMDLTQQARDALAILRQHGASQAYIFGNSAGASIALRLAEFFPEVVAGMVAHEPMTPSILPDRQHWIDFNMQVEQSYREKGAGPAMALLAGAMVGMAPGGQPPRPGTDDMDFFLGNEFMSLCYYQPDLERLRRNGTRLIASKGRLSANAYYARSADVVSERTGCPLRVMSGNHIAHLADPTTFAAELRAMLNELQAHTPSGAS